MGTYGWAYLQFFGSALQVTPHFHWLVPDGVFVQREGGVRFEALPPPTQGEVERLRRGVRHRLPVGVVNEPILPEQLTSLATFMCKHEQVPLPVPSRLPAGARASDYIRQEDLDFLARKAAAAQATPSEGPGLDEERAGDAVCQVTSVESLGEHVRVTLLRNGEKGR